MNKTTTTTPATTTPANVNPFDVLLSTFATAYTERTLFEVPCPYDKATDPDRRRAWLKAKRETEDKYTKALYTLGKACGLSVLKKVIDPTRHNSNDDPTAVIITPDHDPRLTVYSYGDKDTAVDSGFSPALVSLRSEVLAVDHIFAQEANDIVEHDDYMKKATGIHLGDGLDPVNVAIVAILDETRRQLERDPGDPVDLTRPYEKRQLKRKVYIKDPASLGGYETVETTPIQEIYKAVRRYIQESRHVQLDPRNGYTYLEDLYADPDGDGDSDPTVIYRRLPKFADIGGHAMDGDRDPDDPVLTRCVNSYGDRQTVEDMDDLIESLGLTARQNLILTYRLQGYGYKAIATRLGVSDKAVKKTVMQIKTKAEAIGLTLEKYKTPTPTPATK